MTAILSRKSIFDAVRKLLGRGFRQREVDTLNDAIDSAMVGLEFSHQDSVPCVPSVQNRRQKPESVSKAAISLIKRFEGCGRLRSDGLVQAYPDPGTGGEPWTIGWGATGPEIGPSTVWTQEQCDRRLAHDLARYAAEVAQAIGECPTTQQQFDALVSFHYNTGAIFRATLTRKHVAQDFAGAAKEFGRWNKAGGRMLKGLSRRRLAEASLYLQA